MADKAMTDKEYIKMLKERDKAKPMKKYKYNSLLDKKWEYYELCPTCGEIVVDRYVFCPTCGQRIDHENYQL